MMMLGVDIIKTKRMQGMMERFGEKALKRFLFDEEIVLVKGYKTAAGFWAAKEALSKAVGSGIGSQCSFFDIKIYKTEAGAPQLALSKELIERFQIEEASLSITHDGEYAVSVVVLQSATTNKVKQF